jgi:ubiquinone/menaquinone biosynthesis C-methylase UbiE
MLQDYFKKARERSWDIYSKYYPRGAYKTHDDRYREAIGRYLKPGARLLDAGCGSEMEFTREFHGNACTAVGYDIECPKLSHPGPSAVQGNLNDLPFKDHTFDVIISKSVLEHLSDPEAVFREFARVLKRDGAVILLTPNKYDYISLIAHATPFSFHRWILGRLLDRTEEDTFPTFYRANTQKRLVSLFQRSGLTPLKVSLFNQYPSYLMFSPLLFRAGIVYERITSASKRLAPLRAWLIAVGQRQ